MDTRIHTDGKDRYIGLYFDEGDSWGRSVVDGRMSGYKPYLISQGWEVGDDVPFHDVPHFGYQDAYDFIESGIIAWKHLNQYSNIEVRRANHLGNFTMAKRLGYTFEQGG